MRTGELRLADLRAEVPCDAVMSLHAPKKRAAQTKWAILMRANGRYPRLCRMCAIIRITRGLRCGARLSRVRALEMKRLLDERSAKDETIFRRRVKFVRFVRFSMV